MTHAHVCCTRAHASHICINQKSGRGKNLVHPIVMVCERAGGSAAGSFYVCISVIRSAVAAGAQTGASC